MVILILIPAKPIRLSDVTWVGGLNVFTIIVLTKNKQSKKTPAKRPSLLGRVKFVTHEQTHQNHGVVSGFGNDVVKVLVVPLTESQNGGPGSCPTSWESQILAFLLGITFLFQTKKAKKVVDVGIARSQVSGLLLFNRSMRNVDFIVRRGPVV